MMPLKLFERVSNWGRWGPDDERGALNLLTPERVAAAAHLVRSGKTITISRTLNTEPEPDNPFPADHHMRWLLQRGVQRLAAFCHGPGAAIAVRSLR